MSIATPHKSYQHRKLGNTLLVAAITFLSSHVIAFEGHNGITFDMTQKQVEAKGFVCNESETSNTDIILDCSHMEMTGTAFGLPTKNYEVSIGKSKKVIRISVDFGGNVNIQSYLNLTTQIGNFFPKKLADGSMHSKAILRDVWEAKNGAQAVLLFLSGIPPITKDRISISFWPPSR
ncbi:hypothetical protein ACNQFN_01775 [Thauera butanivorans]|uniref:hypothetical protein n=1 Tax=Thauera butanivorans TaxID=86174 RepID=UPI003AB4C493